MFALAILWQSVIKPLFVSLRTSCSQLRTSCSETGQPHHVVRSHNELKVAKVAIALRQTC